MGTKLGTNVDGTQGSKTAGEDEKGKEVDTRGQRYSGELLLSTIMMSQCWTELLL